MKLRRSIFVLFALLMVIGVGSTSVAAFDLDPGGGGNGIEVNTTFTARVTDVQSGDRLENVVVRLKLGGTVLQTGATNSNGEYTFATVTDGGFTDYHITISTVQADPGVIDKVVTSSSTEGTFFETVPFTVNKITRLAVLVGLGKWSDSRFGRTTGFLDVNDWYDNLTDMGFDEIVTLGDDTNSYHDPNKMLATKDNIHSAVSATANAADYNDVVVFVFASHHNLGYMAAWDTKYYRPWTYYGASQFGGAISSCDAGRILVWLHMCHAETFANYAGLNMNADTIDSSLFMCSSHASELSFSDNFRKDFWEHANALGGVKYVSLENIFNSLVQEYPKSYKDSDGVWHHMTPVMINPNTDSFYLI